MIYHAKMLHNYFIPCHRKYSDKYIQCVIRVAHEGKVACNTVEKTTDFLYSDWLCVLWHGINHSMLREDYSVITATNLM